MASMIPNNLPKLPRAKPMEVGKIYRVTRSGRLEIALHSSWSESYHDSKMEILNSTGTFMVVEGPVYAPYKAQIEEDKQFRSEISSDFKEVVGYKILAPGIIGWVYLWAEQTIDIFQIEEVTKSNSSRI